jgi:translocation and assembly module TamA
MPRTVIAGWGGRGDFMPNPEIDPGIMRSILTRVRWGDDLTHLWLQYENGRESLFSSDFDFAQLIVQGRVRWRIGWAQNLHLRARFGTTLGGTLPVQKRFVAGGIGTVRGYQYQTLVTGDDGLDPGIYGGEQLGLLNVEYVLGVHEDLGVGIFYDTGMVHEETGGLRLDDFRNSLGVALLLADSGEGALRLDLIQPLESGGQFMVQGRITRPF